MPRKPATKAPPRPRLGAHLAKLRRDAGLTQAELATAIGASQQNVAWWEKSARPPRADVLAKIADVFRVRVDDILARADVASKPLPQRGPAGQVLRAFEEVRKLPRHQQLKVVEIVAAIVEQFKKKAS